MVRQVVGLRHRLVLTPVHYHFSTFRPPYLPSSGRGCRVGSAFERRNKTEYANRNTTRNTYATQNGIAISHVNTTQESKMSNNDAFNMVILLNFPNCSIHYMERGMEGWEWINKAPVINYGEGGGRLQNGKIVGPKGFAPPPQD